MIFHQIDDENVNPIKNRKEICRTNVCFYEMFCKERAKYGRAKCNERTEYAVLVDPSEM